MSYRSWHTYFYRVRKRETAWKICEIFRAVSFSDPTAFVYRDSKEQREEVLHSLLEF